MNHSMLTRARATALLFGGAALCATSSRGQAQASATIRVAVTQIEPAAEAYYAKDLGFFAKAGLDADIQVMQAVGPIAVAVASNAMDIGFTTIDTLASANQKNIPLIVIAPASEYLFPTTKGIGALVLPANSTVRTAKDLSGKTIATPSLNSAGETGPRMWIDKNGGDSSSVKFIEIPFPAMPAALAAGRVDAASVAEPFIGPALKNGQVLAYFWDAVSNHFLISAWITTPQWAKDHPDLVKQFASVMHETAVWANANATKSGDILAKYSKIGPAVIATMVRAHYSEQLTPTLMQPLIDVTAKYGKFPTFPAQELIYAPPR